MGLGSMTLRLVVAVGLFFCVITAGFAWYSARALWLSPSAPKRSTVAEAPQNRWVVLEDAVLDCSTAKVKPRYTLVRATDRNGAHPFVAQLSSTRGCEAVAQLPLEGAFIGRFSRMFLAVRQDFALPPGKDVAVFSQFEAPQYLKRALPWRLAWFGLSLLVTLLAMNALWVGDSKRPVEGPRVTKSGRVPARD